MKVDSDNKLKSQLRIKVITKKMETKMNFKIEKNEIRISEIEIIIPLTPSEIVSHEWLNIFNSIIRKYGFDGEREDGFTFSFLWVHGRIIYIKLPKETKKEKLAAMIEDQKRLAERFAERTDTRYNRIEEKRKNAQKIKEEEEKADEKTLEYIKRLDI